jgi:hypothetical protein
VDVEGYAQYYDIRSTGSRQSTEQMPKEGEPERSTEDAIPGFDRRELSEDQRRAGGITKPGPIALGAAHPMSESTAGQSTGQGGRKG